MKTDARQSLGEEITQLIISLYFDELDFARTEVLAKPMTLYRIMLRPRCHATWLKLTKSEGTNVVLMDADVEISSVRDFETETTTKLLNEVDEREEILARGAKGDAFCFHR